MFQCSTSSAAFVYGTSVTFKLLCNVDGTLGGDQQRISISERTLGVPISDRILSLDYSKEFVDQIGQDDVCLSGVEQAKRPPHLLVSRRT